MTTEPLQPKPHPESITKALMALKPGEALRLTTAREAYCLAGLRGMINRRSPALRIRTRVDKNDVLILMEPRVATEKPFQVGRPRATTKRTNHEHHQV